MDELPVPLVLQRQSSEAEKALEQFKDVAATVHESLVHVDRKLHGELVDSMKGEKGLPPTLFGCVFVGHTNTDMDSIGSAIAAAELFNGVAARASEVNSETAFALKHWGLDVPEPFLDVGLNKPVCLVDHNQISQMAEGVDLRRIKGCIDHHALQSGTIATSLPIYVKIRPWGSACTIIADMFVRRKQVVSKSSAGILLSGILSDTLNLTSPTTTDADRRMLSVLSRIAGVTDINGLAKQMFKAKSRHLLSLSAHGLVNGDLKLFNFIKNGVTYTVAFGVVETVDPAALMGRREELLTELKALKKEKKLQIAFLALVDIIQQTSVLLLCGQAERDLCKQAYPDCDIDAGLGLADLKTRVSRKLQFIPPIEERIADGWVPPPDLLRQDSNELEETDFGEVGVECTSHGCMVKRRPTMKSMTRKLIHAQRLFSGQHPTSGHNHNHERKSETPPVQKASLVNPVLLSVLAQVSQEDPPNALARVAELLTEHVQQQSKVE